MKHPILKSCFFAATLAGAFIATADTFCWVPDANVWGDFSNVENWKIGDTNGVAATRLPGAGDTLSDFRNMNFNLGGNTYDVGNWNALGDWKLYDLGITNGTLRFVTNVDIHYGKIDIYDGGELVFPSSCYLCSGRNSGAPRFFNVYEGGRLIFDNCKLNAYTFTLTNDGYVEFDPASFYSSWSEQSNKILNRGTLVLPNGISFEKQTDNIGTTVVEQAAGTMILNGPVKPTTVNPVKAPFRFIVSGGTLKVTKNDVSISCEEVSVTGNSTFEIPTDITFDLAPFTINPPARISKTGAGTLIAGPAKVPALSINEGTLELGGGNDTYDFSGTTFADGTTIMLSNNGMTFVGTETIADGVSFVAKWEDLAKYSPIVTSEDDGLLAKIIEDLNATKPAGLISSIVGNSIQIEVDSDFVFDATDENIDITDPSAWRCGYVPENEAVRISGENVCAIINGELPAFKSISVVNGATLKIRANSILPAIEIAGSSALDIESGIVEMLNGFSSSGSIDSLPSLTLASQATLKINQSVKFKNINMSLAGVLEQTEYGHLVLGTAGPDETSFLGLNVDGATFKLVGSEWNAEVSDIKIACTDIGGKVVPTGELRMKNFQIIVANSGELGIQFGVNNSPDSQLRLVCENSYIGNYKYKADRFPDSGLLSRASTYFGSGLTIGGNSTLVMGTNCFWEAKWDLWHKGKGVRLFDKGQLRVESGAVLNQYNTANGINLSPSDDDFPSFVLAGGEVLVGNCHGNGKGIWRIEGGTIKLLYQHHYDTNSGEAGYYTTLFEGSKAVEVVDGHTLTICGTEMSQRRMDKCVTNNVPFIGGGSLVVTNTHPEHTMYLYQMANTSTITGSLKVADVENTKVVFGNGANWGGTVYAKNVETDHANAVTTSNSFGGLCLDDDWHMTVTADGISDYLSLTGDGFSGDGKIIFSGDDVKVSNMKNVLFATQKSSCELPRARASNGSLHVTAKKNTEDESLVNLTFGNSPFLLIIR